MTSQLIGIYSHNVYEFNLLVNVSKFQLVALSKLTFQHKKVKKNR